MSALFRVCRCLIGSYRSSFNGAKVVITLQSTFQSNIATLFTTYCHVGTLCIRKYKRNNYYTLHDWRLGRKSDREHKLWSEWLDNQPQSKPDVSCDQRLSALDKQAT